MVAEAPIRETMAAALVLMMERAARDLKLYQGAVELVDAMAGTGTFLLEAQGLRREVTSRGYGFEAWPNHQRRSEVRSRGKPLFARLRGFDRDLKNATAANENLAQAGCDARVDHQDLFLMSPLERGVARWSVMNPPYGVRLKIEGPISRYYEKVIAALELAVAPELAGFVFPEAGLGRGLELPAGWREVERVRFKNGGLPVAAVLYHCAR
jgi:23S rRNA G2445 N2-methylase RlmL